MLWKVSVYNVIVLFFGGGENIFFGCTLWGVGQSSCPSPLPMAPPFPYNSVWVIERFVVFKGLRSRNFMRKMFRHRLASMFPRTRLTIIVVLSGQRHGPCFSWRSSFAFCGWAYERCMELISLGGKLSARYVLKACHQWDNA